MRILFVGICDDYVEGKLNDALTGTVFCGKCGCTRSIRGVVVREWYARCYSCRYKRWFGRNESLAKLAANGHWRNHRGHKTTYSAETRKASQEALAKMRERGLRVAPIGRLWYTQIRTENR